MINEYREKKGGDRAEEGFRRPGSTTLEGLGLPHYQGFSGNTLEVVGARKRYSRKRHQRVRKSSANCGS